MPPIGQQARWRETHLGHQLILEERDQVLRCLLAQHGLSPLDKLDVLEIGCGDGENLGLLLNWGAEADRLHGIDQLPERITREPVAEFERKLPCIKI